MHVLLVAAVPTPPDVVGAADGPEADTEGGTAAAAAALATVWATAAPHCAVEPLGLPAATPAPPLPPGERAPSAGVFVPTTALGLTSVEPPRPAAGTELLVERVGGADLVVVHVPVLDTGALHEGPVAECARAAASHALPVVVLAGRITSTRRELAAAGVAGAHDVGDPARPESVRRVAHTWAPAWHGRSRP